MLQPLQITSASIARESRRNKGDAAPSVSRSRRLLALLLCLLGVASVIFSYFYLPFLSTLEGNTTITGWEWVSEFANNMQALGGPPASLFGISLALLPLVAAAALGALGIARVISPKPSLALLYLIVCLLGGLVLGLTLIIAVYFLRLGALGEAAGYALCFWADSLWRGKRPAYVNIWKEAA